MAAPAWAQTSRKSRRRPRLPPTAPWPLRRQGEIIVTATKRASTRPGRALLDQRADARRTSSAPMLRRSRTSAATSRALPCRTSGRARARCSVRGVSAGQIVRDQPGVKEQVGVYLDEIGHLAVAVHAGLRPVRPQPRRDPARAAGHAVRLGLGRRHRPLHHQPAEARRDRRRWSKPTSTVDEGDIGGTSRARQHAARRHRSPSGSSIYARTTRASSMPSGRPAARTSMTATAPEARSRCSGSQRPTSRSRRGSSTRRSDADGFNREEIFNLYANRVHRFRRTSSASASNICSCARSSRTIRCWPTSPQLRFRRRSS